MILGLGTDIVNVERIERTLNKFGSHFIDKTFTVSEAEDIRKFADGSRNQACKAAKIFAAKEAAVKALGTGFNHGVSWLEVEVSHDELGKPLVNLSGRAAERASDLSNGAEFQLLLSLSDDYPFAQAVVIIEKM